MDVPSIRSIFAILLLPLFCIMGFGFMVGSTLNGTVLRGPFLARELERAKVYDAAVDELAQRVDESLALTPDHGTSVDLAPVVQSVVTEDWLQRETERNLDRLDDWLNQDGTLELTLDLTDRKPALATGLEVMLNGVFDRLPACAGEPAASIHSISEACVPTGMNREAFRAYLAEQQLGSDDLVAGLPDTIDLLQLDASLGPFAEQLGGKIPSTRVAEALGQFRDGVATFRSALILLAVLTAGFGAGLLVLVARGLRSTLRWLGGIAAAVAALPLFAGFAGLAVASSTITTNVTSSGLTPASQVALETLIRGVLRAQFTPLLAFGAGAVIIAIVLHAVARALPSPTAKHPS